MSPGQNCLPCPRGVAVILLKWVEAHTSLSYQLWCQTQPSEVDSTLDQIALWLCREGLAQAPTCPVSPGHPLLGNLSSGGDPRGLEDAAVRTLDRSTGAGDSSPSPWTGCSSGALLPLCICWWLQALLSGWFRVGSCRCPARTSHPPVLGILPPQPASPQTKEPVLVGPFPARGIESEWEVQEVDPGAGAEGWAGTAAKFVRD